ncbi:DUF3445 domain-containing protein [Marimonas sp. MJW-29]|uniref:DUF3445 domain-containing protein n=1 Tax=Sulfitobacter sediminis TaxID=3234186 RepID=A0ABV3RU76_9RHOB
MQEILQNHLPEEMTGENTLPGVGPCAPDDWLRVDEAYGAQMAYRLHLLGDRPDKVLWMAPEALEAAQEVLREALKLLPKLGFSVSGDGARCPDGREVPIDRDDPLRTLGMLVQEDICILQKRGDEHALTGAVLCFPANWRLAEKAGRPLVAIHEPVHDYDDDIARRVQRLFNGVRAGRPLWRFNRLSYVEADLHQPRKKEQGADAPFIRSERQCIIRMPQTQAVVFTIHTWCVRRV